MVSPDLRFLAICQLAIEIAVPQNSDPMPWPSSAAADAVSSNAPTIVGYGARSGLPTIAATDADYHPVHGAPAGDSSSKVLLCGKMVDTGGQNDGYVTKIDISSFSGGNGYEAPDSSVQWSLKWGSAGQRDCCNGVASTASHAFVAGMQNEQRFLAKIDLASGSAFTWSAALPDGTASAVEYMSLTSSGGIVCTGVGQGAAGTMEGFKSYGNPSAGRAFLMYFAPAIVSAATAPSAATWDKSYGDTYLRGLTVKEMSDGSFLVLLMKTEAAVAGQKTSLLKTDASGTQTWIIDYTDFGEPTDMQLLSDGHILIVGIDHSSGTAGTGTDGAVMKVSSDGTNVVWKRVYGDPTGGRWQYSGISAPNPLLIYEECWGAMATSDGGAVVSCGTGIEGCTSGGASLCHCKASNLQTECNADARKTWRSMVFKIDSNGNVLWSRVDNWKSGTSSADPATSASEYVFAMADGKIVSVNDEGFGIGVLVLDSSEGQTITSTTSANSTTSTSTSTKTTTITSTAPSPSPAADGQVDAACPLQLAWLQSLCLGSLCLLVAVASHGL